MFKKLFFTIFIFNFCCAENLEINITAKDHEKMNFLIGIIGQQDKYLKKFTDIIKADLEFSGQLNVTVQQFDQIKNKKDLQDIEKRGFPLILFLSKPEKNKIEWRLYDSAQANMLKGKKLSQTKDNSFVLAHILSDDLWPEIIGQKGCFSSVLVACKKVIGKKKKNYQYIYALQPMEFYAGLSPAVPVVTAPTVSVAPRWHGTKPLLYYSKHTNYNLCLMSIDLNKKSRIVTNFEGLNMTPAFSKEGKIIISLSNGEKNRLYKYDFDNKTKVGSFNALTDASIHALSPSFIDENRIVFCAIDNLNRPKIAILNLNNHKIDYITYSGNCACPTYCIKNNKIAYCKKVNGYMQIFIYDLDTKEHKQMTTNNGDKDNCSWSPCGNFIAFSVENRNSRIAILNLLTGKVIFLTPENENWTYPAWSGIYDELPFID